MSEEQKDYEICDEYAAKRAAEDVYLDIQSLSNTYWDAYWTHFRQKADQLRLELLQKQLEICRICTSAPYRNKLAD
jgi:hypothetical protein